MVFGDGIPTIVSVAKIEHSKGYDRLLEVHKRLIDEENLCYRASAMIHFGIGNIDMAKKCINAAITLMVDKEGLEEYNMARLCNYAVYQDVYGEELT